MSASPSMRATWAIAWASQKRSRTLTPALRRAYGDGEEPDIEAAREALRAAEAITAALREAIALLEAS